MPRAGLSPQAVVARAGDLADREGYDSVTLATLADRLGVKVPSLYKHVSSLGDLQRRLRLDGLRGLADALRDAAVGRSGTDALRAVGTAYRAYAQGHPGRYAATLRALAADDDEEAHVVAAALTDLMLAVVRGYGLEGAAGLHAVRSVRAALHGFVALEHAGGFGMPYDVDASYEHLLTTLDLGLRRPDEGPRRSERRGTPRAAVHPPGASSALEPTPAE